MKKVFLISLGVHVVLLIVLAPWLETRMVFDQEKERQRSEEVRKRELARQEQERLKRERQKLEEGMARKLKQEAERQRRREIEREVARLREMRDEMMERQKRELEEFRKRTKEEVLVKEGEELAELSEKLAEEVRRANEGRPDEDLEEASEELAERLREEGAKFEDVEELGEDVSGIWERLVKRIPESVSGEERHHLVSGKGVAEAMKRELGELGPREDLAEMNDTSASVADKMGELDAADAVGELYDEARGLEKQIAEAAADILAAERALAENESYRVAREGTMVKAPTRPDLGGVLASAESRTGEETVSQVGDYRRSLQQAVSEVADMAARAEAAMRQASNRSLASGGEREGNVFASPAVRMALASQKQGFGAVVDMRAMGQGGAKNLGVGMRADRSGEGSEMGRGRKEKTHLRLDDREIMQKALPGRRFSNESLRQGWLYLDTWYVIGPWENESRVDFEKMHPPELVVDFDAEYFDGKFGREKGHRDEVLKWEFYQSDQVRCQPPRVYGASTYYAYSEVWFEEGRDMLIAVASDDAASVWLNDQIIWRDTGQSAWQLGEGYRRVRFEKGFNTILVRIENGPTLCVWSVLLCPPEVLEE